MRPDFKSLTDAGILSLDDKEIEHYQKMALANAGIPFDRDDDLDPAPIPPVLKKSHTVFKVGDLVFSKRIAAKKVCKAANSSDRLKMHYVTGPNWQQLPRPTSDTVDVEEVTYFSESEWEAAKPILAAAEEEQKAWGARKLKIEEQASERAEVVDKITKRIAEVTEAKADRDRWTRELNRYVDLGLPVDKARAALLLASPEAEEHLPEPVMEELALSGDAMEGES